MIQFYKIEGPSKRTFPYLYGFRTSQNMDEYLKLKANQAQSIAKEESKGLGDMRYQSLYQHGLSKVRKLEDFARDLSKPMPELSPTADLQKELKVDYLDLIMKDKPYKANRSQFKDWSLKALKEEVNRIKMMNKDPKMKKSAPNWNKFKKVDVNDALRNKRKRAELVAAGYGPARSIAR
ncbi:hypothetical protein Hanom_Chr02g00118361 [Helianthus anomalus]